ncbi:MAG: hypothetical protein Q8N31_01205 [Reyranella sp.]|nr:hypothetical protein [Reyranella sp.]MDP3158606.1 hypothetical protein [Reyranella sp.]
MRTLARPLRSGSLALLTVLSACVDRSPQTAWSLPPRDNPLTRALTQPQALDLLFLRMNVAVEVLNAVEARNPSQPDGCDRVPLPGCQYVVLVAMDLGKHITCERNEFRISARPPGPPVVSRMNSAEVPCPPGVAK